MHRSDPDTLSPGPGQWPSPSVSWPGHNEMANGELQYQGRLVPNQAPHKYKSFVS